MRVSGGQRGGDHDGRKGRRRHTRDRLIGCVRELREAAFANLAVRGGDVNRVAGAKGHVAEPRRIPADRQAGRRPRKGSFHAATYASAHPSETSARGCSRSSARFHMWRKDVPVTRVRPRNGGRRKPCNRRNRDAGSFSSGVYFRHYGLSLRGTVPTPPVALRPVTRRHRFGVKFSFCQPTRVR